MQTAEPTPHVVSPEAGKTVRVLSDLVTFKALAVNTGGAFSLFETQTAPGQGTPPHRQLLEEESFYVLEGTYAFQIEGRTVEFGPGGFVRVPRGTVHAFTNVGKTPARMLILVTPGGIHENFFAELGVPVDAQPTGAPDFAHIFAVAEKYGVEILTPNS